MDDFRGEEAQYNRLREALRRLYALNIKSGQLERMVEEEAARKVADRRAYLIAEISRAMSHSDALRATANLCFVEVVP